MAMKDYMQKWENWTEGPQVHFRHGVKSSISSNTNSGLLILRSTSSNKIMLVALFVLFQSICISYGWIINTNIIHNIHRQVRAETRKRSCNGVGSQSNAIFSRSLLSSSSSCLKVQPIDNIETVSSTTSTSERDELVRQVIQMARSIGPVGVVRTQEEQDEIVKLAEELEQYSDDNPALVPLQGIHNLIYSAAPGGSSGKLGPFIGSVTQRFVNDVQFINAVTFGPIQIALRAQREIKNSNTIKVTFQRTSVSLFGTTLIDKETKGGGIWKYIFCGTIQDTDGSTLLVRIMKTPSLFIIIQSIETTTS